jgi:hypothetical protein
MRRFNSHRTSAFTMVELMGAVTIAMVLIFLMYSIFDKVQTVFVAGQNRARAMEEGRTAMDLIVDDVRALSGGIDGELENLSWLGEQLDPQVIRKYPTMAPGFLIHNPMGSISASTNDFFATDGSDEKGPRVPAGAGLPLYHHNCRFFVHDDSWQLVHYRFGPRHSYSMNLSLSQGLTNSNSINLSLSQGLTSELRDIPNSPVGSLWVYRSPRKLKGRIKTELGKHQDLIDLDSNSPKGLDEPLGYSKLIDGVIHFRLQAADSTDVIYPSRRFRAFVSGAKTNPFQGFRLPTHVVVELAVLDKKLLKEVEAGLEQQLEGMGAEQQLVRRLEYISENLDRVYFFKQLIRIRNLKDGI